MLADTPKSGDDLGGHEAAECSVVVELGQSVLAISVVSSTIVLQLAKISECWLRYLSVGDAVWRGARPKSLRGDYLRRPPNAGEREDASGFVAGLVVDLDVMANKGVEVEWVHGRGGVPGTERRVAMSDVLAGTRASHIVS